MMKDVEVKIMKKALCSIEILLIFNRSLAERENRKG